MKLIAKKMSFFFMIDGFFRKVVFWGDSPLRSTISSADLWLFKKVSKAKIIISA